MPIKVDQNLAAIPILAKENIFIMNDTRAQTQQIRPLKIIILNLMPTKAVTEIQLLRLLSNTPLQIEVTFLHTASHQSKNTSAEYLNQFYSTFDEIKQNYYDGLIITGAPVEELEFEKVHYWKELTTMMEWSKSHVFSTLHICWGAQAGLYYHYHLDKTPLNKKCFGIFESDIKKPLDPLFSGFDDAFYIPHSRHTTVLKEKIASCDALEILAQGENEAQISIVKSKDNKAIYIFGHAEYDKDTLSQEYFRDLKAHKPISLPRNYFPNDDPNLSPKMNWHASATLLFTNWLNYYVYQETPYIIEKLKENQA